MGGVGGLLVGLTWRTDGGLRGRSAGWTSESHMLFVEPLFFFLFFFQRRRRRPLHSLLH